MIELSDIVYLHKVTVHRWHLYDLDNPYEGFLMLVGRQHQQNYRLWHQEDIARSPEVSDAKLAQVKRHIDRLNQQRNDLIEQMDECLLGELEAADVTPMPDARLHSETPGSIIDRLSILALRIYHMEEQARRGDAGSHHRAKAKARLDVLYEQLHDLSHGLAELLDDLCSGRKRLKVYRQFKMYNDPAMNPHLYRAKRRLAA